jgi:hypothetical protein
MAKFLQRQAQRYERLDIASRAYDLNDNVQTWCWDAGYLTCRSRKRRRLIVLGVLVTAQVGREEL